MGALADDSISGVSVVIPAYNSASSILEAVGSALNQSGLDVEVIVVDDGSSDQTGALVSELQDSRLRLLRQENGGPAAARNAGVGVASYSLVAFLDADDEWLADSLLERVQPLYGDSYDMICGGALARGVEDCSVASGGVTTDITLLDLAVQNRICTSSVVMRKDVFEAVGGFDTAFRGPEDYDLWLRIAASHRIGKVAGHHVRYDDRPGSLSGLAERFLDEVFAVLKKAFEGGVLSDYQYLKPASVASQYVSASWMEWMCGDRAKALSRLKQSITTCPRPLKGVKRGYHRGKLALRYLFGKRPGGCS